MKKFLLSSALCLLTACGFTTLYGTHENRAAVEAQLANVQVMSIQDEMGQQLRNNLLDLMPPAAPNARYQLRLMTSESAFGVAIARDATVTRQELRDNVHAELYDTQTQKVVWRQDTSATAGYNVLGSQYSNLISAEDARHRNLDDLSGRIVTLLSLYFNRPVDERTSGRN